MGRLDLSVLSVWQILDGRYEILAPLAEGGMGAVYRARRILLGDDVAVKVILADAQGPAPLERFVRESRACAQLRHPNIVSILDYNADDPQRPFLVMELLSGPSLKENWRSAAGCPLEDVQADRAAGVLGLALAHARGIIHRDLKPANIVAHDFGGGDRVYKVVDFGVATVRQSGDETRLTGSQQFIGTVAYAPPEQLTGGIVDARSDVYSLGVLLFELVSGRLPFEGTDPMAVVSGPPVQTGADAERCLSRAAGVAGRGGGTRPREGPRRPVAGHASSAGRCRRRMQSASPTERGPNSTCAMFRPAVFGGLRERPPHGDVEPQRQPGKDARSAAPVWTGGRTRPPSHPLPRTAAGRSRARNQDPQRIDVQRASTGLR